MVELVRERLSHTLRHTDLAATDFAHYDAAKGRCGSRGQAEHRPISLAPKVNSGGRVSLNVCLLQRTGELFPLARCRTSHLHRRMSVIGVKADMTRTLDNVR